MIHVFNNEVVGYCGISLLITICLISNLSVNLNLFFNIYIYLYFLFSALSTVGAF